MKSATLTEEDKKEIIRLYQEGGWTCNKLAIKYKVFNSAITRLLKKNGVVVIKDKSKLCRIYQFDDSFFDCLNTKEKAYFLGLLYADGCNHEKQGATVITLQERDVDILEKFREAIKGEMPISFIKGKNEKHQNLRRLVLHSRKISDGLRDLGCFKKKSLTLKFPKDILEPELLKSFLLGYIDGDGCLFSGKRTNGYFYTLVTLTSTKDFCEGAKELIRRTTGVESYVNIPSKYKGTDSPTRTLVISGNKQVIKLLNWLYEGEEVFLNRKKDKYMEMKEKLNV